jgi:repressor LexA
MAARSKRQREILNFVTEFLEIKGYSPSYHEIASGLGLASKGAVARHIEALESLGLIQRVRDESGFVLRPSLTSATGCRHISIKWYGNSGDEDDPKPLPVLSEESLGLFEPDRLVAFEVDDDSMSGDGIHEDDVVFVELRTLATDSEIVLAEVDRQLVLRRYSRSDNSVLLSSSNARFDELTIPFSKLTVIGIVRGLIRPLK